MPDPEIPVLSILDLGIVRDVTVEESLDNKVTVTLTPTYSGCPATEAIESDVLAALKGHGVDDIAIKRVLSPPWTTDWISEEGREKTAALWHRATQPQPGNRLSAMRINEYRAR